MNVVFKKILMIVSSIVAVVMIGGGGVAKLVGPPRVVQMLTGYGVGNYILFLGVTEIILIILFLLPKTRRIGYLLICCYFGGAIATAFSHQGRLINPAILPLLVATLNIYLRDGALFQKESKEPSIG